MLKSIELKHKIKSKIICSINVYLLSIQLFLSMQHMQINRVESILITAYLRISYGIRFDILRQNNGLIIRMLFIAWTILLCG